MAMVCLRLSPLVQTEFFWSPAGEQKPWTTGFQPVHQGWMTGFKFNDKFTIYIEILAMVSGPESLYKKNSPVRFFDNFPGRTQPE